MFLSRPLKNRKLEGQASGQVSHPAHKRQAEYTRYPRGPQHAGAPRSIRPFHAGHCTQVSLSPGLKSDILSGKTGRNWPQPPASSHIVQSRTTAEKRALHPSSAVTPNYITRYGARLQAFFQKNSNFFRGRSDGKNRRNTGDLTNHFPWYPACGIPPYPVDNPALSQAVGSAA